MKYEILLKKVISLFNNIKDKGFFHFLSSNFVVHFVTFLSQLIVAHLLTPEDIGRIKLLQVYTNLGVIIAGAGFPVAILKICSGPKRSDQEKTDVYIKGVLFTTLFSGLVICAIMIGSYFQIFSIDPEVNTLFYVYGFLVLPLALNKLFISVYQSKKQFVLLSKLQVLTSSLNIVFIIGVTYYFLIYGYIVSLIVGFSLSVGILMYNTGLWEELKSVIHSLFTKIESFSEDKELRNYAGYGMVTNLIGIASMNMSYLILNYFTIDREEFGYFSFAFTIVMGLQIVITSVQRMVTPFFSEKSQDFQEWYRVFKKYNLLFLFLLAGIAVAAYLIGPPILDWLFNGKYNGSFIYLELLLIYWFLKGAYSLVGPVFIGLGRVDLNFKNVTVALILTAPVAFWLIMKYGVLGAAYSMIVHSLISLVVVYSAFVMVINKTK
ncbi:oligosaccharide flippase family protein [Fodinibius halophilus]|uniref:Oligosaccharide flippase family protein n=1 Tax=Fodinibius halophilus TaxID=1736908 RepID=A0A6M1T2Q9_9BACT|nr:oligosaccharide flippase family protein [Fodinibius halophilus]NGP88319.1 oligosaccharide flippase family protein [Fodinibius halophilus]